MATNKDPDGVPPLLRLPRNIREQIYLSLGVLGSMSEHIILDSGMSGGNSVSCWATTFNLLLTCRKLYHEISVKLYRDCPLVIHAKHTNKTLGTLWGLRPASVRALRNLAIFLHVTSCDDWVYGDYCDEALFPTHAKRDHVGTLDIQDSQSRVLLENWHEVWRMHILPLLAPGQLNLRIICDAANLATAQYAVQPLYDQQHILAGCSIRLGRKRDPELMTLAKATVLQATTEINTLRSVATPSCFCIMDLSPELRQHVLSFTDLITPWHEVEWTPDYGMYCRYPREDEFNYKNKNAAPVCWRSQAADFSMGCFCQVQHSAYSTNPCKCWRPPTSILLVNRQLRSEALRVFYGQNKFTIVPTVTFALVSDDSITFAPTRFFTTGMAHEGLPFLRNLDIAMLPLGRSDTYFRDAEYYQWLRALDSIKSHLDLPRLTIQLYLPISSHFELGPEYTKLVSNVSQERAKNACVLFAATFRTLVGLGRFHVHCWKLNENREFEAELESLIMGPDYNAVAAGKEKMSMSSWLSQEWCVVH